MKNSTRHVKYNHSFNGRLIRMYIKMCNRSKKRGYSNLIDKESFLKYGKRSAVYKRLYKNWKASNFKLALTPSIDRINNNLGYIKGNIQLLSFRDNAAKHNHNGKNIKACSNFIGVAWVGRRNRWEAGFKHKNRHVYIGRFTNQREAAKAVNEKCRELGLPIKNRFLRKK
jgi:hypothetical protein